MDVRLPSRAMNYSAVWPEAWTWMSKNINITSRVDGQDKRCPEEKLYGKRFRKQLLPFLMPGRRTRGSGPKWAGKADPCLYLNGGNDHASDCDKVMLESGIASYTTNATYAYRRAPFVGQNTTFRRGHPRSFAAAGRHVDGREWNRRSGWSIGGKRCRHRSLSATGRIFGWEGRRRRSARSPGPRREHWGGNHPSFTVAGRTVNGRMRHRCST